MAVNLETLCLRLAAFGLLGTLAACAVHEPVPVFRAGVFLGDRGISVPLPPPSLLDSPEQEVEVAGEVQSDEPLAVGSVVLVLDVRSGAETSYALDEDDGSFAVVLPLDLRDHCLELWVEDPEGLQSPRSQYQAIIVDETTLQVQGDCE